MMDIMNPRYRYLTTVEHLLELLHLSSDVDIDGHTEIDNLNVVVSRFVGFSILNDYKSSQDDLNVTGVTKASTDMIHTQFDITNNASGAYEFVATGIGFLQ